MVERIADRQLVWSGEHWVAYLREPGGDSDTGVVSLYNVRYSRAGEGRVAFLDVAGDDRFPAIVTDNRDVATFAIETMVRGRGNIFDRELDVVGGQLAFGGDIRTAPWWTVTSELGEIVVAWNDFQPPLILEGPGPVFDGLAVTYSLLFFTDGATITHDGKDIGGKPYTKDIWRRAIGRPASSCVFALAETTTRGD